MDSLQHVPRGISTIRFRVLLSTRTYTCAPAIMAVVELGLGRAYCGQGRRRKVAPQLRAASTQHYDAALEAPRYNYSVMMHPLSPSIKAFG